MFNIFETMKKYLFALVGIMLISAMTFSFSSCSEDSVEDIGKGNPDITSPLVGKWKSVDEGGTIEFEFKSDYTGVSVYNGYDGREEGSFIWLYDEEDKILEIIEVEGDVAESGKMPVEWVDENVMRWYEEGNENDYLVVIRQ